MAMLESFYEDLGRNPEDWKVRSVMADWFEDNANPTAAECLRWMIKHKKRPYHGSSGTFTWFNADSIDPGLGDPESDIPGVLYQHLKGQETAHHKTYDKLRTAEEDFVAAWTLARQGGWGAEGG
jgi:uncharacterized protein (TIGR02996 family)